MLERKGSKFALLVTQGFQDVCAIGTQARPKLFDLNIRKPGVLYEEVIEIKERVAIEDFTLNPFPVEHDFNDPDLRKTESGEVVRIIEPLDKEGTKKQLRKLWDEGYRSLAVALMFSLVFSGSLPSLLTCTILPFLANSKYRPRTKNSPTSPQDRIRVHINLLISKPSYQTSKQGNVLKYRCVSISSYQALR